LTLFIFPRRLKAAVDLQAMISTGQPPDVTDPPRKSPFPKKIPA